MKRRRDGSSFIAKQKEEKEAKEAEKALVDALSALMGAAVRDVDKQTAPLMSFIDKQKDRESFIQTTAFVLAMRTICPHDDLDNTRRSTTMNSLAILAFLLHRYNGLIRIFVEYTGLLRQICISYPLTPADTIQSHPLLFLGALLLRWQPRLVSEYPQISVHTGIIMHKMSTVGIRSLEPLPDSMVLLPGESEPEARWSFSTLEQNLRCAGAKSESFTDSPYSNLFSDTCNLIDTARNIISVVDMPWTERLLATTPRFPSVPSADGGGIDDLDAIILPDVTAIAAAAVGDPSKTAADEVEEDGEEWEAVAESVAPVLKVMQADAGDGSEGGLDSELLRELRTLAKIMQRRIQPAVIKLLEEVRLLPANGEGMDANPVRVIILRETYVQPLSEAAQLLDNIRFKLMDLGLIKPDAYSGSGEMGTPAAKNAAADAAVEQAGVAERGLMLAALKDQLRRGISAYGKEFAELVGIPELLSEAPKQSNDAKLAMPPSQRLQHAMKGLRKASGSSRSRAAR